MRFIFILGKEGVECENVISAILFFQHILGNYLIFLKAAAEVFMVLMLFILVANNHVGVTNNQIESVQLSLLQLVQFALKF